MKASPCIKGKGGGGLDVQILPLYLHKKNKSAAQKHICTDVEQQEITVFLRRVATCVAPCAEKQLH